MKEKILHLFVPCVSFCLLFAAPALSAYAQSQALNGQIEGTVSDQNNAVIANAVISASNIETGATRTATTDESGVYRFPLLPIGNYRITAKAEGFKRHVRDGITLNTGQTATVNIEFQTGSMVETVTVSADTSVADAGKIDLGRVIDTRDVQNLPNLPRNPYNFGLLQANVSGRPSRNSTFPEINVNGYLRRVNYLLDGNTNTQGDRGSVRFMLISETFVSEIQLVTNNFSAEFGNTPGMILNVVTPAGTNGFRGAVSYRFRRPKFYSRPFFYPAKDMPDNRADNFTATVGGAIIKDRWHFYFGYEWLNRGDKATAARLLTIQPVHKAQLIAAGLPASIFPVAVPGSERGLFYIFRTDLQIDESKRLTARLNHSDFRLKNNIPGGLNTLERSTDSTSTIYGLALQVAAYTPKTLNEFRFQYAQRRGTQGTGVRNDFSGSSPAITITGVANFGSNANPSSNLPANRITQFQDNLTRINAAHVVKFGGGFSHYDYTTRSDISSIYTFPSIAAYIAARSGTNPKSYTSYSETSGEPEFNYKATFWNFFVQDDWKPTRRLKINYGLRYDLYRIPEADPSSPFQASQKFNVDENNFAPRLGIVYALREGNRPTIIRAGAGIYTDAPLLAMYQRALQNNGSPKFFSYSFTPTSPDAPSFPNTFSGSLPPGSPMPVQRNIDAISPDFENMYALHTNVQLEQAITENLSLAAGYVHSAGRHLPVYRNINCLPVGGSLADGRPIFGTATLNPTTRVITINPCLDRLFPQFQNIQMVESVGVSQYDALTFQLTKRFSRGLQFSAIYTLSKAADDAPEQNMTTGSIQGLVLSDPSNRALDKGNSFADQRHTFVMSMIARPHFSFENRMLRVLFNNNLFGIIATANSGERFNITAGFDLNADGVSTSDRPVGIERNAGKTPPQYNVDLRYSRFFDFTERYKLEVFSEFQNLFNTGSIITYNNVSVPTNLLTGELIGEIPDFKKRNQSTSQESRQVQIGVRFIF
jgi:hypothetical protein